MSNHLITECSKRKIGSLTRFAMMSYLADKASDDGRGIYASKQTMADELDTTKKTVIDTIKALIADGLLIVVGERACVNGHTVEYAIDVEALRALPLVACWQRKKDREDARATSEAATPVKQGDRYRSDTGRGIAATPKPPLEPIPPSQPDGCEAPAADLDDQEQEAVILPGGGLVGESGPGITPPRPAPVELPPPPVSVKPHRLPDSWTAPPIAELGDVSRALASQWPSGAYQAVEAQFIAHWQQAEGRTAKKSNWGAAWSKWIITEHDKIMRAAKAGTSFAVLAPAKPASASQPARPVAAKDREDDRSAAFHTVLERALGASTYRRYLKPAAILFEGGEITVIVGTDFQRSYIETNLLPGMAVALARWNAPVSIVSEAKQSPPSERNSDHGQVRQA